MSGQGTGHDGRASLSSWAAASLVILSAVAAVAAAVVLSGRHHEVTASARPRPAIPAQSARLLRLSPAPAAAAPGFTLTDQDGRVLSLSAFRGRAVVLEFMDSRCTGICPLVSREFIDAYHDLGPAASHVVFAAVNVNAYHHGVADIAGFSREQRLTTIPSWHFLTGPVASLQAVWKAYHVYVQAPGPNADIVHTSVVYFIDPSGKERFAASPMADHTQNGTAYLPLAEQAAWGRGLALIARQLAR